MLTRTKGEWLDRLEAAGVLCAPIYDLREALAEPQTAATGMIQRVPDLDLELIGLPISFDGVSPPIRRPPTWASITMKSSAADPRVWAASEVKSRFE